MVDGSLGCFGRLGPQGGLAKLGKGCLCRLALVALLQENRERHVVAFALRGLGGRLRLGDLGSGLRLCNRLGGRRFDDRLGRDGLLLPHLLHLGGFGGWFGKINRHWPSHSGGGVGASYASS